MAALRRRIYTPNDLLVHNLREDCWVSFYHKVFDLTPLLSQNHGALTKPILEAAGHDISDWFDFEGGVVKVKTQVDPVSGLLLPFVPMGRFVHVPPNDPVSNWKNDFGLPWWRDDSKYCIGTLTQKTRVVRIVNTLTKDEHLLEVGGEETLEEIQDRYLTFNKHGLSYTWKALDNGEFRALDSSKTLAENGVPDESGELTQLGLDEKDFAPVLQLYFNDDLTEA